MIIPSIDLMGGQAVQLVGGKATEIEAGDPRPIAERFRLAGEIAVIDLDAALSQGDNQALIKDLIDIAPCRVGGGIRDVDTAVRWLDAGAEKIILGTKAVPEILEQLPRDRVIAALDAVHGEIVVEGWTEKTGQTVEARMAALNPLVGGFLVTFVESEGRLEGIDLERVNALAKLAGPGRLTVAGGVTTLDDIASIDRAGADAQVGMALYKNKIDLGDAIGAPVGLEEARPTIVTDPRGQLLGFGSSNRETLRRSVKEQRVRLTERDTEDRLLRVELDDAREILVFRAQPSDGHAQFRQPEGLGSLLDRLVERTRSAPEGSYTARLLGDPTLLRGKLLEEAAELAAASPEEAAWETADLIYFTLVAMARSGVSLDAVERELARRSKKVTRRKGDAKPPIS